MIQPRLIAKAALFNNDGRVLILRRSATDKLRPGRFDLPGGHIDEGESPTEAVIREISEEVGLQLSPETVNLMYANTEYYEGISCIRFLFVGVISDEPSLTLSHEHDASEWMSLDEAFEKYDHPTWIAGLKYLKDNDLL